jgi:hypothetical protein
MVESEYVPPKSLSEIFRINVWHTFQNIDIGFPNDTVRNSLKKIGSKDPSGGAWIVSFRVHFSIGHDGHDDRPWPSIHQPLDV